MIPKVDILYSAETASFEDLKRERKKKSRFIDEVRVAFVPLNEKPKRVISGKSLSCSHHSTC